MHMQEVKDAFSRHEQYKQDLVKYRNAINDVNSAINTMRSNIS
jgi:soluble cytochrome b562